MSQFSDEFIDDNDTIPLTIKNNNFITPNNKIFHRANPQNQYYDRAPQRQLKSVAVLKRNKIDRAQLSEEFQNFLIDDQSNAQLNVVSLMGCKKIGSSFLTDCLVSQGQGRVLRNMSKATKNTINAHGNLINSKSEQKILYFDCNGQIKPQEFLWCYFVSSTIVFSMNFADKHSQNLFLKYIDYIRYNLQFDADDLSMPQLIIAYRDYQPQQKSKSNPFIERIQESNLFDGDVVISYLSFPGNNASKAKQLPDIPEKAFNPQFPKQLKQLENIIKLNRAKAFKGNYMTAKILSLTIQPLTKQINKDRALNAAMIWDQVIQTLSVGFYNYYIVQYTDRLQKQFQDEKPVDKYTLYKKLSSVKRAIDKKVDGFTNISTDPIFQKYIDKLKETITTKEKMIKEINRVKAKNANNQLCKQLMNKINGQNYSEIIDQYCKNSFDDDRTQVLLENFEKVIQMKLTEVGRSKQPAKKPSIQIQKLQNQIKVLQEQIEKQKTVKSKPKSYDFDTVKNSIKEKQQEVKKLQKELQQQFKINGGSQSRIINNQIQQLEGQISDMKEKVKQQEQKIKALKSERQKKVREVVQQLQKKRRVQEDKLNKLEEMLRKAKVSPQQAKKKAQKDSCCEIM